MSRLSIRGMAVAAGVTWGLGVLGLGVLSLLGWGSDAVTVLGSVYPGFRSSPVGIVVGVVWGVLDGAVGGALLAFFYNLAVRD